jgi:hypothetical protein
VCVVRGIATIIIVIIVSVEKEEDGKADHEKWNQW